MRGPIRNHSRVAKGHIDYIVGLDDAQLGSAEGMTVRERSSFVGGDPRLGRRVEEALDGIP